MTASAKLTSCHCSPKHSEMRRPVPAAKRVRVRSGSLRLSNTAYACSGVRIIGTRGGLVRFDGIRFVPWSPRNGKLLPSSVIVSLLAAQDGSLWIGTSLGLSHWVDEDIFNYSQAPGAITAIVQGDDERIWFLAESPTNGICVVADLGALCYTSQPSTLSA